SGDEARFLELWRNLQPRLLRYLRVLGCDDPDDVASETWLQVIRDLHRFNGDEEDFRRWLFTVGRHRAIDAARARTRRRASPVTDMFAGLAGQQMVEDQVLDGMSVRTAVGMLAALSPDQAEAVALRVIAGLDTTAVADILGKSPGAVRVALHRGLRTLAADPRVRALATDVGLARPASDKSLLALGEGGEVDSIGPVEPGLDVLLGLLTSGPTSGELAGEDTALEMYRAIQRPAIVTSGPRVPGSTARRQARRRRWLAAAGTVATAAALTVAAYTQALPAPLQNAAYHLLGFVGVSRAHHPSRAPGAALPTRGGRPRPPKGPAGGRPPTAPRRPRSPRAAPGEGAFPPGPAEPVDRPREAPDRGGPGRHAGRPPHRPGQG